MMTNTLVSKKTVRYKSLSINKLGKDFYIEDYIRNKIRNFLRDNIKETFCKSSYY